MTRAEFSAGSSPARGPNRGDMMNIEGDTVLGRVSPDDVLAFMARVAAFQVIQ